MRTLAIRDSYVSIDCWGDHESQVQLARSWCITFNVGFLNRAMVSKHAVFRRRGINLKDWSPFGEANPGHRWWCQGRGLGWFPKRVSFPQLNKGNRTRFDPPVISTGRRLKTSACLRFYAVFSRVCTHWPSLKLSPARCLYQPARESSWVLFLPLATRLSGVSKSRDPGVIEKSRTS